MSGDSGKGSTSCGRTPYLINKCHCRGSEGSGWGKKEGSRNRARERDNANTLKTQTHWEHEEMQLKTNKKARELDYACIKTQIQKAFYVNSILKHLTHIKN